MPSGSAEDCWAVSSALNGPRQLRSGALSFCLVICCFSTVVIASNLTPLPLPHTHLLGEGPRLASAIPKAQTQTQTQGELIQPLGCLYVEP